MSTTSTSSSEYSLYQTFITPPLPHSFYALHNIPSFTLPHDGTASPRTSNDDTNNFHRRTHVFGTPTSQAGTVDDSASADSEVELAHGDVGMDTVRNSRGSRIGSRGSDGWAGSIRSFLRNEDRVAEVAVARGGHSDSAWVLLDDGAGADVPEPGGGRQISTSDGTTSQPSPEELLQPPRRRGSVESRFSEDLPKPRRVNSPLQWIRNRVRPRPDIRNFDFTPASDQDKDKPKPKPVASALRKLKKRPSGIVMVMEATEPSSRSNIILTAFPAPSAPPDHPFLAQVNTTLLASRPNSRIRRLSQEVTRLVSGVSPARTSSFEFPTSSSRFPLPPRPQSAPPRNSIWDLEFLPSEATGVKTPKDLPVYAASRLGGQPMLHAKELNYFNLADMVQSQPPLAAANERTSKLGPHQVEQDQQLMTATSYSPDDRRAIAPFIEQDLIASRPSSPVKAALSATSQKIRRASLHAKSLVARKLSDVTETPQWLLRRGSVDSGFSGRNPRRGQDGSELEEVGKPAEVVIEQRRRRKRDSGVIGLDPVRPDAISESTDDSYTYSSAVRDIAGLDKRPRGGKKAEELGKGKGDWGAGDAAAAGVASGECFAWGSAGGRQGRGEW